jgi:hypothetical protein
MVTLDPPPFFRRRNNVPTRPLSLRQFFHSFRGTKGDFMVSQATKLSLKLICGKWDNKGQALILDQLF